MRYFFQSFMMSRRRKIFICVYSTNRPDLSLSLALELASCSFMNIGVVAGHLDQTVHLVSSHLHGARPAVSWGINIQSLQGE